MCTTLNGGVESPCIKMIQLFLKVEWAYVCSMAEALGSAAWKCCWKTALCEKRIETMIYTYYLIYFTIFTTQYIFCLLWNSAIDT